MRYAKLATGVLLAVAAAFATVGAMGGWIHLATSCVGAPSASVTAYTCSHPPVLVSTLEWSVLAGVLWVSAAAAIRSRASEQMAEPLLET
jgi:hypothetical protein